MSKIKIIEIQRFSIHDGPGIRTTIFLKGCPLRCGWCANPESQSLETHLFYLKNKCKLCLRCLNICPNKAITLNDNELIINDSLCVKCGACVNFCLYDALKLVGEEYEIEKLIDLLAMDEDYYFESNGGITISGGEPFVQFESLVNLIKSIKDKGYHLCIETTANTTLENLLTVSDDVDLFYIDYKSDCSNDLLKINGNLSLIENNIKELVKRNDVVVRIPVIPNYNQEFIEVMIKIIKELGVNEIHLLPFHNYAKNKYQQMRTPYEYENVKSLEKEELKQYLELANKYDCIIKIG